MKQSKRQFILFIALFVSYIFGLVLIFPSSIVIDNNVVVNIIAHYFGWVFGFSIAFLLYRDDVY
ncbi:MAG: hypothetical protein QXF82_09340 [Nitrososphaeria archaeon]